MHYLRRPDCTGPSASHHDDYHNHSIGECQCQLTARDHHTRRLHGNQKNDYDHLQLIAAL